MLAALAPGPAPTGGLPQGHRAAEDLDTGLETTHHSDVLHSAHVGPAEKTEGSKPARTQVSRPTTMPRRLETVTISCDLRAPSTHEPKRVSCLRGVWPWPGGGDPVIQAFNGLSPTPGGWFP